ncbi:WXG100 family type VII secretion target [Kutzneria buriramensis]|uniref:Type VII secretion system (Wss) protein ESAT-6 n=1 Tax=Kutzneria buriramensis TaxID=1045776 RepID=A0A3E0HYS3_9PSEU|nr:WXG100 family type VII secretion target [Kutzneria buriramensis]REH51628.1 type VII secretion system (Wss) protein ESAT-6 [Kutzneria buriramensis]
MTDISGVVASVLSSYLNVLDQCAKQVTGDPGALQQHAQRQADEAKNLAAVSTEISGCAGKTDASWQGTAQKAFASAAGILTKDIDDVTQQLNTESRRLSMTASAIQTTMSSMDTVRSEFLQYAKVLIDEARTAATGSEQAFLNACQQLGVSAVKSATALRQRLADALTQLYGLKPETAEPAEKEDEGPGKVKVDLTQLKKGSLSWIGDEILDGRKRPRSVPSWFSNSGWYKLTDDGFSGTRAPKKDDTPFGDAELPEKAGAGQKLWHSTDITLLKGEGLIGDDSWGGKVGDNVDEAHAYLGPRATWDGSALVHGGEFRLDGKIQGTLADVGASGALTDGVVTAKGDVDAYVGGQLGGHLDGSSHGVAAHLDAFAGAKLSGSAGVDVAGIGVGAKGELEAGIGAQFDGQATMDNGHIKVNFKVGAALGVGASVGANIDVDLPKVWETASHYGHEAMESVSNTARQAARAMVAW